MNRLQLVNDLRRECSVAGNAVPTTLNQSGEFARLIEWIDQAHEEIQSEIFDWKFLWATGTKQTVPGNSVIQPPSDLGVWDVKRKIYIDGEEVDIINYDGYEPTAQDNAKPYELAIRPDNALQLIPAPDDVYTVIFDYFKEPAVLSSDTDTPLIPKQFHRAIVGRAVILYANYESAEELKIQGGEIYQTAMQQLRNHQSGKRQQTYGRSDPEDIVVQVDNS